MNSVMHSKVANVMMTMMKMINTTIIDMAKILTADSLRLGLASTVD